MDAVLSSSANAFWVLLAINSFPAMIVLTLGGRRWALTLALVAVVMSPLTWILGVGISCTLSLMLGEPSGAEWRDLNLCVTTLFAAVTTELFLGRSALAFRLKTMVLRLHDALNC